MIYIAVFRSVIPCDPTTARLRPQNFKLHQRHWFSHVWVKNMNTTRVQKLPWWRISQFHQEIPFIKLAGPKSPGPTFEAEHLRADVASGWVLASPHSDTAFSSVSPSPPLDHHHDCQQFTNTLLYNQHLQIHQLSQFSPGAQTFYQKRITSAKMEPSRYKQYP